jgi:peptide deformylase
MKIAILNDPVLREPTSIVAPEELDYIKSLIPEMTAVMNAEEGAGLAANQVGISKRFFILKDGDGVRLIINPDIVSMGTERSTQEEGCLSIPGAFAPIERADSLTLVYHDEAFEKKVESFNGFAARAVQHEVDHLDGKLYIDQLGPTRKMLVVEKHKKFIKLRGRRK